MDRKEFYKLRNEYIQKITIVSPMINTSFFWENNSLATKININIESFKNTFYNNIQNHEIIMDKSDNYEQNLYIEKYILR